MSQGSVDLDRYLTDVVYPRLFERMDAAFPEFSWVRKGSHWTATTWPSGFPLAVENERPERLMVYPSPNYLVTVHGHYTEGVRFLDLVNGGTSPRGRDFIDAVRTLCEKAGVEFPERKLSPEEEARVQKREGRRNALEGVMEWARKVLWSPEGEGARAYLRDGRGLTDDEIRDLGLGLYSSVGECRRFLEAKGYDLAEAKDAAVLWPKLEGYVLVPWADPYGRPLTIYGRWPKKTPPDDGRPKTLALRGEGTKSSPLYFDRARAAGHSDLVAVEGVFDAALLQAQGDSRVVAYVAAQFSGSQVETLVRHRVRSVTIVPDPDGGGDKGVLSSIRALTEAGIAAYVAPRLPDGLDPDEFLLREGLEGWNGLVDAAVHAFTFQASQIIERHKGEGEWTEKGLSAALDEAVLYDEAVTNPDRFTDLDLFFWPAIREATGVDEGALHARLLAVRERKEKKAQADAYEALLREAGGKVREGDIAGVRDLLMKATSRIKLEERGRRAEPARPLAEELGDHDAKISRWRGREFLGLPQKTLPQLDEHTRGLRGLMLLAAKPNAGKTCLAVQLGTDIVTHNPDAVFVFVSLEMTRWDIYTRVRCRFAGMDWGTFVFGSEGRGRVSFTPDETARIQKADEKLREVGGRLLILDESNLTTPSVESIVAHVEALKARTGASRAFLLLDYLQVWPIPPDESRNVRTDLEGDKWRIGAMKELRNALDEGDGVMVISEARKPSGDSSDSWGGALADVMGSARGSYTPDMVLLLNDVSDVELGEWISDPVQGSPRGTGDATKKWRDWRDRIIEKRRVLADEQGLALAKLVIAKGRDGVRRGDIRLTFNFRQSSFGQDWPSKIYGV